MKTVHWILLASAALASLALQLFGPRPSHPHAWDAIPLFYGIFGLAGSLLLIGLSRFLARAFLQQPEDYYERRDD